MPYLDPPFKKESSTVLGEGYATTTDLDSFIKGYGDPGPGQFFYELEPAEVIKVYLDAEDLINSKQIIDNSEDGEVKPDWSKYGYIEARLVYSKTNIEDIRVFAPMDTNIKEYKLIITN